jgi:hypothetical protein
MCVGVGRASDYRHMQGQGCSPSRTVWTPKLHSYALPETQLHPDGEMSVETQKAGVVLGGVGATCPKKQSVGPAPGGMQLTHKIPQALPSLV